MYQSMCKRKISNIRDALSSSSNINVSRRDSSFNPKKSNISITKLHLIILAAVSLYVSSLLNGYVNVGLYVNCEALAHPTEVVELTNDNYEAKTKDYQVVVLNFYADWCPYSARWKPIFSKSALHIYELTKNQTSSLILFGFINSVVETTLSTRFRVTKFPTTKLTINGVLQQKEYRGARTMEAFTEFILKVLQDPTIYVKDFVELTNKVVEAKSAVIMFSGNQQENILSKPVASNEKDTFVRVAQQFKDYCDFFYVLGHPDTEAYTSSSSFLVKFKPDHKPLGNEILYQGQLTDLNKLTDWVKSNCIPLVREITFENAEELTEGGLPFVILFYDPSDKSTIELYKRVVETEAKDPGVTFVFADGHVFQHPLHHLGKTKKDLPLIAIDSFRHLFLYKDTVASISQPMKLKQFILDLHSGKLDREFHFGPDPIKDQPVAPPESAFQKLAPSSNRYSFPRDEL